MRNIRLAFFFVITIAALFVFFNPVDAGRCYFFSAEVGMICGGRKDLDQSQFEAPDMREDSLLEYTSYAYMEDNINIYPEPNPSVPPLYNVGEGFLYVTIHGELEANGHKWYVVNPGEYALAEDIRLVSTPSFHGVEITAHPDLPFGWIVLEVRPSSEPDGEPNPDFQKLERFAFFQVFDAAVGEEDWIWYQIGGGRWIKQTHVSLVEPNPPPPEVGPGEFWVEVDLYEQSFAAYQGSDMVYAGLVSSGLNRWPTYEGIFQVWSRYLRTRMMGAEGKIDYYNIEDVPFTMYFDRDNEIALHGAYWHDRYGYKHSHGCVNMPPIDAEWIYHWSENAPNDLWVWVHTSDPMAYFERFTGHTTAAN
jgi:hypothetical protein